MDVTLRLRAGISELRTPRRITARDISGRAQRGARGARGRLGAKTRSRRRRRWSADFLGVGQAARRRAAGADGRPSATTGRSSWPERAGARDGRCRRRAARMTCATASTPSGGGR
ncbi:MAG: hypothetical protein ACLUNO_08815 [Oscillospiraceae bacterium]